MMTHINDAAAIDAPTLWYDRATASSISALSRDLWFLKSTATVFTENVLTSDTFTVPKRQPQKT